MVQSFGDRSGNIAGGNLFTGFDKDYFVLGVKATDRTLLFQLRAKYGGGFVRSGAVNGVWSIPSHLS